MTHAGPLSHLTFNLSPAGDTCLVGTSEVHLVDCTLRRLLELGHVSFFFLFFDLA